MAFNVKNGIKIIEGKAYVHPFTKTDLENMMALLSNIQVAGDDIQILFDLKEKVKKEYELIQIHEKQ
jgi:hypothetical protein